jgi:HAD superfamily hydrolase (TIGR01509 family)
MMRADMMQLSLPDYPFRAYIFDCDGTLVDSMPQHHRAWRQSLAEHGATFDFDEASFYGKAGLKEQDVVAALNAAHGTQLDADSVARRKNECYAQQYAAHVRPIQPVVDIARAAQGRLPMAVASGSELHLVHTMLEVNGLLELFPVIITPEAVLHGKPAPDMFLLAAEKMGIPAPDCLVFEDGLPGIQAAQAAGMQHVFIPRMNENPC